MNVGVPNYCTVEKDIWCIISPLICFHIVKWHRIDWVLRQFGFCQRIRQPCDNASILHKSDLRGRYDVDWTIRHRDYILCWGSRHKHMLGA